MSPEVRLLAILMIAVTGFRLWMTSVQRLSVFNGPHDDLLFLDAAQSLKHFRWLGTYNERTLIKGPGYPMFVAVVSVLHVPLLLAQQVYDAVACGVFVVAIRPRVRSAWLLGVVYAFLLLNPVMVSEGNWSVLREGIYSGQCILVVGTLMGLLVRGEASRRVRVGWAVAAGYAISAVVITREEGVWLAPAIAILLGWTAWDLWGRRMKGLVGRWEWVWVPAVPVVLTCGVMLLVSAINWAVYRSFCVVEVKESNFVAAIAAMQRVEPAQFQRLVPVTKETRRELAMVSPAFAKLEGVLEGKVGEAWAKRSEAYEELRGTGEIGGAWWIWAVRDGVARLGLYHRSGDARRFYGEVAAEINGAIDRGVLKGAPLHNTLAPPWRAEYAGLMRERSVPMVRELFSLANQYPRPKRYQSVGNAGAIEYFEHAAHEEALPTEAAEAAGVGGEIRGSVRGRVLWGLQGLYGWIVLPLGCLGAGAVVLMVVVPGLRRRSGWVIVGVVGILAATAVRCVLLLYIDVSSFSAAVDPRYIGPAQTFLMVAEVLAIVGGISGAMDVWRLKVSARREAALRA